MTIPAVRQATGMGAGVLKTVRVLRSADEHEARRRVLALYKSWIGNIPYHLKRYRIELTEKQAKDKCRELFRANKHVTDVRTIDMLTAKGEMQLEEFVKLWMQATHLMRYFKQSEPPRRKEFMEKFLHGNE